MDKIHPSAVFENPETIRFGEDVEIGAFVYLCGPLHIGHGTKIFPYAIIGCDGEHRAKPSSGLILIGQRTIIREGVVVQRGVEDRTEIGDDCYIMDRCHIAHDVLLEDEVTLSPGVILGGSTHVLRGATMGIGSMTHQLSTIGAYAMVGMGAVVTRDVPPFWTVVGNPARFLKSNQRGIDRAEGDTSVWTFSFAEHSRRDVLGC